MPVLIFSTFSINPPCHVFHCLPWCSSRQPQYFPHCILRPYLPLSQRRRRGERLVGWVGGGGKQLEFCLPAEPHPQPEMLASPLTSTPSAARGSNQLAISTPVVRTSLETINLSPLAALVMAAFAKACATSLTSTIRRDWHLLSPESQPEKRLTETEPDNSEGGR